MKSIFECVGGEGRREQKKCALTPWQLIKCYFNDNDDDDDDLLTRDFKNFSALSLNTHIHAAIHPNSDAHLCSVLARLLARFRSASLLFFTQFIQKHDSRVAYF